VLAWVDPSPPNDGVRGLVERCPAERPPWLEVRRCVSRSRWPTHTLIASLVGDQGCTDVCRGRSSGVGSV